MLLYYHLNRAKEPAPYASYNIQLRNMMMLFRKCTNHPYLIEYPLLPSGQFQIDEQLAMGSGKLMMLDSMLAELKKRGHKVC